MEPLSHTPRFRGGGGLGAFIPLACQDSQTVVPSHPYGQHLETCENAISFFIFFRIFFFFFKRGEGRGKKKQ